MNTDSELEHVRVRNLRPKDLEPVIDLDARLTGRRRAEYFKVKLAQAMSDTGVMVSLAAELDGAFTGFLLARVYYGEFGLTEQTAVLDTLGVHPDFRKRGIGTALMRQLRENLMGLGIPRLQTEVPWSNLDLLAFFHECGFEPARRLCLDLDLSAARHREELREMENSPESRPSTM